MDEANKTVILIVGIIVVLVIVGVVFGIIAFTNNAQDTQMDNLAVALGQMDATKYNAYDNKSVKGAKVKMALETFRDTPTAVVVKTKAGAYVNYLAQLQSAPSGAPTTTYAEPFDLTTDWDNTATYNTNLKATTRPSDPNFIKDTAVYDCWLIKDNNKNTVGILAIQQP